MFVRVFQGADLARLVELYGVSLPCVDPYYGGSLEQAGPSYTVLDGQAVPICAGGIAHLWNGRAEAWAVMTPATRPYMAGITRCVRSFFDQADVRRIDFAVRADFAAGARWAEMLGFEREGLMRAYGPDGQDHYRYARVRG